MLVPPANHVKFWMSQKGVKRPNFRPDISPKLYLGIQFLNKKIILEDFSDSTYV